MWRSLTSLGGLGLLLLLVGCEASRRPVADLPGAESLPTIMVRVEIRDRTQHQPIPADADVQLGEQAPWTFGASLKDGVARKDLGRLNIKERVILLVRPDGPNGKSLKVPVMVNTTMAPEGSDNDMLILEISDDELVATGRPFRTATAQYESKVNR
jgi:hypothetical protein